jgi:effector-binding domain-containing protein
VYQVTPRRIHEQPALVVTGKLRVADIRDWFGHALSMVFGQIERKGLVCVGPPFARFRSLDDQFDEFEVEAGFPIASADDGEGEVVSLTLPGGMAAMTTHIGPYDQMKPAYEAIYTWITEHHASPEGPAWEVYYTDPSAEPDPKTWRTEIYQPYRLG